MANTKFRNTEDQHEFVETLPANVFFSKHGIKRVQFLENKFEDGAVNIFMTLDGKSGHVSNHVQQLIKSGEPLGNWDEWDISIMRKPDGEMYSSLHKRGNQANVLNTFDV